MKKTLYSFLFPLLILTAISTVAITSCDHGTSFSKENGNETSTASNGAAGTVITSTPSVTLPSIKLGDPLPANIFVELAKLINPTVVNVSTEIRQRRQQFGFPGFPGGPGGPGARDPFWEFFEEFMGPNGMQQGEAPPAQSLGTGFIIDADGLILTNNHVVEAADKIRVQLIGNSEKFYDAKVIGADKRFDIALIKIKTDKKLQHAALGSSEETQVGEWVAAFGNPYGHSFSVSKGIISAKGRRIRDINALPFLQTDASINPGNSGGPLVNLKGQVIGMNTAIDARAQGIGFAIPIDQVKQVLPELKDKGRIVRGYIGVQVDNVTPRIKQGLGLKSDEGAIVISVIPDSPAARGGLKSYDVITKIDGKKIVDARDLLDAIKDTPVGHKVAVDLVRNGKKETANVMISEPPGESGPVASQFTAPKSGKKNQTDYGFQVVDYSEKAAQELRVTAGTPRGPIVSKITQGSSAAKNGLRVGDVILDVNKTRVAKASEVSTLMTQETNVLRVANGERVSLIFIESP